MDRDRSNDPMDRNRRNDPMDRSRSNDPLDPAQGTERQTKRTNTPPDDRMITGMFSDRTSAERAYDNMKDRGYTDDEISLIMSDDTRESEFSDEDRDKSDMGNKALEGTGAGSAIGGAAGAAAGILAAVGTSVAIPGLGIVIAGPIAAGLAGAGAGGIAGGLIGALVGAGIPKERAEYYEKGIKNGKIVMGVHPRTQEDAEYIKNDWRNLQAEEVQY